MTSIDDGFETAVRLYRTRYPFPVPDGFEVLAGVTEPYEDGPFIYECYGCLGWRQKEEHAFCPDCGGTWREIWEPDPETARRIQEIMDRPPIALPSYAPIPIVCANWKACDRELPYGHRGPYCDWCSGC